MSECERDRRIEANLGLCQKHARWIYHRIRRRIPLEDLTQAGMLGLINAANRFDERVGVRFRTFADRHVRGAIVDLIRRETKSQLKTRAVFAPIELCVSLSDPKVRNPKVAADLAIVRGRLAKLPERERLIVELYYGEDLSDAQIAARLGNEIGMARVGQLRRAAIERLRNRL